MLEGDLARDTVGANNCDSKTLSYVILKDMHLIIELETSDCIRVGQEIPRAEYFIDWETRDKLEAGGNFSAQPSEYCQCVSA